MELTVTMSEIKENIHFLRGRQVLIDSHLALLYGVDTRQLNRAVKRNHLRFPVDFRFQLLQHEFSTLKERNHGGHRKLPFAFTQEGVAMLSSVLNTDRAVQVNVAIMRAYILIRQEIMLDSPLAKKLDQVEAQLKELKSLVQQNIHPSANQTPTANRSLPSFPALVDTKTEQIDLITNVITQTFKISPRALHQRTRLKEIVFPRQIAIYLIRKHTGWGFKQISRHFGLKDHTTALYAYEKIASHLSLNDPIAVTVKRIEEHISIN